LVVTTGIARETFGCVDLPAVVVFLRGGKDGNVAFAIGERVVFGLLGIGFASTTARV
jgi:hypothetical protein